MASAPRIIAANTAPEIITEFAFDEGSASTSLAQTESLLKYLYDEVGSGLFDVICLLPEYGLSRAGMRLLQRHSPEIVARLQSPVVVAELGSG